MINRERWTELSKLELELTVYGIFAGGKPDAVIAAVRSMMSETRSRIFHEGFSARTLAKTLRNKHADLLLQKQQLKKLQEMTV